MKYRSKGGDVLDLVCHRYYGDTPHRVEAVYDANPGLAAHGPVLPAGIVIDMPEAQPIEPRAIRLWD